MDTVAERVSGGAAPSAAALEMVQRLIAFPTVSRDSNLGLIEFARDYLEHLGAKTRLTYDGSRKKANLFATLGAARSGGLVLSGHTDVVPIDGQAWDSDPFAAHIHEGKLYARGSADMKGFIGVALTSGQRFLDAMQAGTLETPIHYALSYDEEVGCLGVRGLIRDLEEAGIRPAGCIVGEPTSMQPIIAHKGTHRFRCMVSGREAHSSYVTQGVNAIEYAARVIVFIRELAERLAREETRNYGFTVPYTTLSTGTIRGGIAANVVPKDCEFQFDVRTLPSMPLATLQAQIEACVEELRARMHAEDPDSGIELVCASSTQGLNASEADAIVRYAMALTGRSETGKVSYGTEAGLFQEAGIASVICGPGDIAQAHRPNEFVELAELARCEAFLARLALAPFRPD